MDNDPRNDEDFVRAEAKRTHEKYPDLGGKISEFIDGQLGVVLTPIEALRFGMRYDKALGEFIAEAEQAHHAEEEPDEPIDLIDMFKDLLDCEHCPKRSTCTVLKD